MPSHQLSREESARRKARVIDLRRQRRPWDAIGAEFDVSPQRAHQIYRDALAEYPVAALGELRGEEGELIDLAVRRLLGIAVDASVHARTRVEAWSAVRGWSEHRARLFGLNAPTRSQVDVVTHDSLTRELERLAAELGGEQDPPAVSHEAAALLSGDGDGA